MIDTRGLGRTTTCPTPVAASTATSAGVTYAPAEASDRTGRRSRRRPGVPRGRAWARWQISTAAMPWSVQAGGTTTSAAAGSGAPAATEKQVPGASRTGRQLAATRSPTTLSRTGRAGARAEQSSDRAA